MPDEIDWCEECRILGDDYTYDNEDACTDCVYNPNNDPYDD